MRIHHQVVIALILWGISTLQCKAQTNNLEVSRFQVNPTKWERFLTKSGVLLVVPPHTFDVPRGKQLTIEVEERSKNDTDLQRERFVRIVCLAGTEPIHINLHKCIYLELQIPDFNWFPALFIEDSFGTQAEGVACPYAVKFPPRSLWLPTTCDGHPNYEGYHDSIFSKSNRGSYVFTREFQMRYLLIACEWDEFGTYLQSKWTPLHAVDQRVAGFFLDRLVAMKDFDVPYRHDSILLKRFDFFESLKQCGVATASACEDTLAASLDWRRCESIVRRKILSLPRKRWLHDRKFVPLLISDDRWYGVAKTTR